MNLFPHYCDIIVYFEPFTKHYGKGHDLLMELQPRSTLNYVLFLKILGLSSVVKIKFLILTRSAHEVIVPSGYKLFNSELIIGENIKLNSLR